MKNNLKDFIQLTNFEFERMSKFLFGLMGFTLITNLIAYIYLPFQYMRNVNEYMTSNSATIKEALEIFPLFSFYDLTNSLWIIGPILIGISGLLFYAVFTWYREWLGKNTFAYRLFMLPISRMTIFFSKLVNIFIGIFALIASQMISLGMGYPIVAMIVDQDFFSNLSLIESVRMNMDFQYFLPFQPSFFLAVNGAGLVFLILLFTFILMERSFGIKGIIFGIVYAIFSVLIILFPLFISNLFKNYYILYESETIFLVMLSFTIVGISSLFISRYLLNKKITV